MRVVDQEAIGPERAAVVAVDRRGVIQHANDAVLARTGHTDLAGQRLTVLLPHLRGGHLDAFARTLFARRLAARIVRMPILQADGTQAALDLTICVHRARSVVPAATPWTPGAPAAAASVVGRVRQDGFPQRAYHLV